MNMVHPNYSFDGRLGSINNKLTKYKFQNSTIEIFSINFSTKNGVCSNEF